jgi:hypothetical protein
MAVAANYNAGTGAVLHSPATVSISATANEAAAQTDASWLLTQVSLPVSATRKAGEPAGDEGQLAHPSIGPVATPNVVDGHAWWVLPGVRSEVLAYIRAHPPAGTSIAFSGSAATRGRTTSESIAFAWPPIADVLGMRWLVITVVQIPGGHTGLRADAQAVWITPRPVSEAILGGAHLLRISVHSVIAVNQPHQRPLHVTSAHKIAQVIALLNSLPVAQPGVRSCPADFGISVRLAFYPTSRATPLGGRRDRPSGLRRCRIDAQWQASAATFRRTASHAGTTAHGIVDRSYRPHTGRQAPRHPEPVAVCAFRPPRTPAEPFAARPTPRPALCVKRCGRDRYAPGKRPAPRTTCVAKPCELRRTHRTRPHVRYTLCLDVAQ